MISINTDTAYEVGLKNKETSKRYRFFFQPFLVVLLFFLYFIHLSFAHDIVVKRNSNLREEPTSSSRLLHQLKPGDELVLINIEKENGYYYVTNKNFIGWIWANNVIVQQEYRRDQWDWIDEDGDGQDTRTEVLIVESEIPVTFTTNESTKVASGRWTDPYTGEIFTDPKDLDIDHMVPLKNAHLSGGWLWSLEKRRKFANDLVNPEHLIAVDKSANRSKGTKGPDEWLPSNQLYRCDYVKNWVKIKTRWNLTITEEERTAIDSILTQCPN